MTDNESMIRNLARVAPPVRRLPPPHRRVARWLALALPVIALFGMIMGARPDLGERLAEPEFLLPLVAALATAVCAAHAAFSSCVPGSPPLTLWLPAPPLAVWIGSLGQQCWDHWLRYGPEGVIFRPDPVCLPIIAMVGAIPAAAMVVMARRGAPLAPRLTAWLSTLWRSEEEEIARPDYLDATLASTPALALRALVLECWRLHTLGLDLARARLDAKAADKAKLDARQGALIELAAAIRGFLSQLSTQPMAPGTARALPDLVRAIQHGEDLCAASGELASLRRPRVGEGVKPTLDAMDLAVREALARAGEADAFTDTAEATETAYQALKGALLSSLAEGETGLSSVDGGLALARRYRRMAEAARDGRRRLEPWLEEGGIARDAATAIDGRGETR